MQISLKSLVILIPFGYSLSMDGRQEHMIDLEAQIAELKARWPAHSLQPWMLQELEKLEEELETLMRKSQKEE
jgi:hypothetical protein